MSFKKHLAMAALLGCGASLIFADTIQLKDKSSVTGKILAEKPEQTVVDIGYTVLVIPRSDIEKILRGEATVPIAKPGSSKSPKARSWTLRIVPRCRK